MTHVFVVDYITFDIHLKYMFAGTGTANEPIFLTNHKTDDIHHAAEKNLVSLVADISRVRKGDKILFYVQSHNGYTGTFFGVYKAVSNPFYCSNNYLYDKLNKALQYRVLIQPFKVYKNGVSEYFALDCLDNISHPSQMCWSLIYRKLRGNRGCTMITDYESDRLIKLIKNANKNHYPTTSNQTGFRYNYTSNQVITNHKKSNYIYKRKISLSITNRLLFKMIHKKAYESHLQAYIVQNISNSTLNTLLIPNPKKYFWLGNEVGCGVGMQKIDILVMQNTNKKLYINIIELKCKNPTIDIFEQLQKYIQWVIEYICPLYINSEIEITPIIIAPFDNESKLINKEFDNSIKTNNIKLNSIRQIHISNKLDFKELS